MRFDVEISGLDEVCRRLEGLQRRIEGVSGEHRVPISELFPPEFMAKHTEFATLDGMFSASGFGVETAEDFTEVPHDEWDTFVRNHTEFATWGEMLSAGSRAWVARQLDL